MLPGINNVASWNCFSRFVSVWSTTDWVMVNFEKKLLEAVSCSQYRCVSQCVFPYLGSSSLLLCSVYRAQAVGLVVLSCYLNMVCIWMISCCRLSDTSAGLTLTGVAKMCNPLFTFHALESLSFWISSTHSAAHSRVLEGFCSSRVENTLPYSLQIARSTVLS